MADIVPLALGRQLDALAVADPLRACQQGSSVLSHLTPYEDLRPPPRVADAGMEIRGTTILGVTSRSFAKSDLAALPFYLLRAAGACESHARPAAVLDDEFDAGKLEGLPQNNQRCTLKFSYTGFYLSNSPIRTSEDCESS